MKYIIVLSKNGKEIETWGSLTSICNAHGFAYHSIKMNSFPFEYKGYTFTKTKYNQRYGK